LFQDYYNNNIKKIPGKKHITELVRHLPNPREKKSEKLTRETKRDFAPWKKPNHVGERKKKQNSPNIGQC